VILRYEIYQYFTSKSTPIKNLRKEKAFPDFVYPLYVRQKLAGCLIDNNTV
jgi:hypothetical protein